MGEGIRPFRTLGAGDDYSHLLRLLDDGEEFVKVNLADPTQKLKAETASYHSGGCQHPFLVVAEPLQSATDDQTHVFRNSHLFDLDVGAKLTGGIEESSLVEQMTVEFLDEEWITLGLIENDAY